MSNTKAITTIEKLIIRVKKDYKEFGTTTFPWFRGELLDTDTPLLPTLYRPRKNGAPPYDENILLQEFRNKAPSLGLFETPPKQNTDEWLFLAQHSGLPTRLLDWTEGLLFALHFALLEKKPVVWMLDPVELNRRSIAINSPQTLKDNEFPLTWFSHSKAPVTANDLITATNDLVSNIQELFETQGKKKAYERRLLPENLGNLNIRAAWENPPMGTNLPVAIRPAYIHPRMSAQRSCFTIHGRIQKSLSDLVDDRVLRKYIISPRYADSMRKDLRTIGITRATVFPDLDNLAKDLSETF
jgi:hypothetical protein